MGRLALIGDYFHFSAAGFGSPRAFDITARRTASRTPGFGYWYRDPMYIVEATKL
jgi:hypothetical protein